MSISGNQIGKDFQELAEMSFDAYRKAGIAFLEAMPVPMYPTGISHPRTHQPLFSPKGTAPFDAYGFWGQDATMIGAEFKATSHREASLSISDAGLREHQLDALSLLAQKGGIARLVWSNAGQVGVLWGEKIIQAHTTFLDAKRTEARPGCKAQLGSKSIKWEEFKVIEPVVISGIPCYDWLLHEFITDPRLPLPKPQIPEASLGAEGPSIPPSA